MQYNWQGFTSTRGYTYGKGSAKRIALGALNSSKLFELHENIETGVKLWRIKQHKRVVLANSMKDLPAKSTRRIIVNSFKSGLRIPKGIKGKAKNTEILSLLENLYTKLSPSIESSLQTTDVIVNITIESNR